MKRNKIIFRCVYNIRFIRLTHIRNNIFYDFCYSGWVAHRSYKNLLDFLGFTSPLFDTTVGGWQKTACAARGSATRLVWKVYHINTKIVKLVELDKGGGAVEAIYEARHASNKIWRSVSIPFKQEGISKVLAVLS